MDEGNGQMTSSYKTDLVWLNLVKIGVRLKLLNELKSTLAGRLFHTLTTPSLNKRSK